MAGGIVEAPAAMTGWAEPAWPEVKNIEERRTRTRSDAGI